MAKSNEIVKTNEEMQAELEEALNLVSEKIVQLINNGSYTLQNVHRNFMTNELEQATLIVGKHHINCRANSEWPNNKGGTEIYLALPNNPVRQKELDEWDIQVIRSDIGDLRGMVEKLVKRKEELLKRYRESE